MKLSKYFRLVRDTALYSVSLVAIFILSLYWGLEIIKFLNCRAQLPMHSQPAMISACTVHGSSHTKCKNRTKENFFPKHLNTAPSEPISNETLLALLAVLTAVAGLLSYVFKQIVHRDIKDDVEKQTKILHSDILIRTQDERIQSKVESNFTSCNVFIRLYMTSLKSRQANIDLLNEAIVFGRESVHVANQIRKGLNENLVARCKNNLAFLLAVAQKDRETAFNLAESLFQSTLVPAKNLEERRHFFVWKATMALVLYRFPGTDSTNRRECLRIVNELLQESHVPDELRNRFKETWTAIMGRDFAGILQDLGS